MVTGGYELLQVVMGGYRWLRVVLVGYGWLWLGYGWVHLVRPGLSGLTGAFKDFSSERGIK